ncbi:hypothetical protein D9V37_08320 [Nocardioides mangrovicus]|uniref:Fenitrothion hydrolase n=1 Tax=Nocardioides mangrovicus TaxID=2478913 RepID=A0A3L8P4D0_9ACTN|nr:hypothetical protein D9V37_08320 [Nocardioides mangrovicus]
MAVPVPLHGVGGAKDLPIPAALAITAGAAALAVSFLVLALAWRVSRFDGSARGRPVAAPLARFVDSLGLRWTLRGLGLAFAAYLAWPTAVGPDVVTNPIFGTFYVLLWVGIVPASLLLGPAFRLVSPVRTLHALVSRARGVRPDQGLARYPAWLGYWPAALGLLAFVWQELANEDGTLLVSVQVWLILYVVITFVGAVVFGDVWLARADPFEVYSTLVGRLAVIGRRADGVLVWRSPLAGLAATPRGPGLVAVLAVLFGSTAFDSYKDNLHWAGFVDSLSVSPELTNSVALVVFCGVIAATFSLAAMATGRGTTVSTERGPRRALPGLLVHSLVPIVVGYMTAHYLSYFVEQGQVTLIQLSDPMVDGSNLLGTGGLTVDYWLSQHPSFLADVKVLAIVVGHITGAVAAHDRVLRLLPPRSRIVGQLPMLVLMVAYTYAGLWLLFSS